MTTADHATHRLAARIRALHDTEPSQGLLDALAVEAENLQRRLDAANAQIAHMLEDDGTEAEALAPVQAPRRAPRPRHGDSMIFTHG